VTLPPADQGLSETVKETLAKAGEKVAAEANRSGPALEAITVTARGEARALGSL
jgi:ferric iron reductase protein FhuF